MVRREISPADFDLSLQASNKILALNSTHVPSVRFPRKHDTRDPGPISPVRIVTLRVRPYNS